MAKTFKLNAELFWTRDMIEYGMFQKDQPKPKYVANFYNLDDDSVDTLKEAGIKVLFNEDKGHYVSAKSTRAFAPVDKAGKKVDVETIGNGSKCVVVGEAYAWEFGKKKGVSLSAQKIVVTELVEYTAKEEEDEFDPVL